MASLESVKKKPSPTKVQHDTPAPDGKVVPGKAGILDELYTGSSGEAGPFLLKVKHAQQMVEPSDDVYDTTPDPPGRVLILTYKTFTKYMNYPTLKMREEAEHDASNLDTLFAQMGYDVESHMDRTRDESLSILEKFISPERLSKAGCAIVVVSSYGGEGQRACFVARDGLVIQVSEMHDPFIKSKSKEIREMPKLFFFQFCREQTVSDTLLGGGGDKKYTDIHISCEAGDGDKEFSYAPAPVNMITFFSTAELFVSWKNEQKGSKFLSVVCEVLAERACEDCLDDLFREVQRRCMNDEWGSVPEKQDLGFKKKFYFNPRLREGSVET